MADGRKLQKAAFDRSNDPHRQALDGQARLIATEYDLWTTYPADGDEPGNGHDAQPGDPPDSASTGADQAL